MHIPSSVILCPHCGNVFSPDPGLPVDAMRRLKREKQYASIGKRCSNCHAYLPVTDYNKSATRVDGLQAICRSCAVLNLDLRAKGNMPLVRLTRAAMQAKNDAANKAAGRP